MDIAQYCYNCDFCTREFRSAKKREHERLCANCAELRRLIRGWAKRGMWVKEKGDPLNEKSSDMKTGSAHPATLVIDADFVRQWSGYYDQRFQGSYDQTEEKAIREWLSRQGEPKYLNKKYFVRLGRWKTKRHTSHYKDNDEKTIIEKTRSAYQASHELEKLDVLRGAKGGLRGVGVAVAATILHYLQPNVFPIFDYHARTTLKKAGLWRRETDDDSKEAWLEYVGIMRELSGRLGITLRTLDKALFAYDKYGP